MTAAAACNVRPHHVVIIIIISQINDDDDDNNIGRDSVDDDEIGLDYCPVTRN